MPGPNCSIPLLIAELVICCGPGAVGTFVPAVVSFCVAQEVAWFPPSDVW
jgi:hypothetical protein